MPNRKSRRAKLRKHERQAHKLVTVFTTYIHPHTGNTVQLAVDICDQQQAAKYISAPNAKVIRAHKDGRICEVHVKSWGDDLKMRSSGGGQSTTYEETVGDHPLTTLKIWDGERFRRWTNDDGFNPRRFNSDLVPRNLIEMARL